MIVANEPPAAGFSIRVRAEELAEDMRQLAMFPKHVEAPQWIARIEATKELAPEIWAMAELIAKEDPDYLHIDPPEGHVVSVGTRPSVALGLVYQEQCCCGWKGEYWKPGFGAEVGTILRGAR